MSYFKGLASAVVIIAFVLTAAPGMRTTEAQQNTSQMKRYYLSGNQVTGKEVTKACREGFHTVCGR